MIKVLIFDIGGVLNKINFSRFYEEVSFEYGINKSDFENYERKLRHHLDLGEFDLDIFFEKLELKFNKKINRTFYLNKLHDNVKWNYDILEFIDENLKKKYQIVILSNNSKLFINKEIFDFLSKYFDKQFYSFDLKLKKPDKKIYLKVLENLNIQASECVLIDDKQKNLISAKNLGLNVILFNSLSDLTETL